MVNMEQFKPTQKGETVTFKKPEEIKGYRKTDDSEITPKESERINKLIKEKSNPVYKKGVERVRKAIQAKSIDQEKLSEVTDRIEKLIEENKKSIDKLFE